MTPVQKALWFIESRIHDDVSLLDIAAASGVSQHHLIRAFGKCVGLSVMKYVKARRLTEAAKILADGAPDILTVALMARYQSHEAFTRAFSDRFQILPHEIRDIGSTTALNLTEALMLDQETDNLTQPIFEARERCVVMGLSKRYNARTKSAIPSLWHELDQYLERLGGRLDVEAYGICSNFSDKGSFDYLCGTKASHSNPDVAKHKTGVIPSGLYASFKHSGHISAIRSSWNEVYNNWLPFSGYKLVNGPEFEFYSADFDPVASHGSVTLNIPVEAI